MHCDGASLLSFSKLFLGANLEGIVDCYYKTYKNEYKYYKYKLTWQELVIVITLLTRPPCRDADLGRCGKNAAEKD